MIEEKAGAAMRRQKIGSPLKLSRRTGTLRYGRKHGGNKPGAGVSPTLPRKNILGGRVPAIANQRGNEEGKEGGRQRGQ